MRRFLVGLLVAAAFCAVLTPTASAAYDDAACRTTSVTWTNDSCAGNQWGIANVQAPEAWAVTRGAGVTVAGAGVWYVDFAGPPTVADGTPEDPRTTWANTRGWNVMPGADTWSAKE